MPAPNTTSHPAIPASPYPNKKAEVMYLSSWKEIANYMGKGVRTVQPYEAEFGLPVKRPAGKSRAGVIATRAEIDAWVDSSPIRAALKRSVGEILERDPGLNEIRQGIREMHELRCQMNALRSETNSSLHLLLAGLEVLMKSSKEQRRHSEEVLDAALNSSRKLPWDLSATNDGKSN